MSESLLVSDVGILCPANMMSNLFLKMFKLPFQMLQIFVSSAIQLWCHTWKRSQVVAEGFIKVFRRMATGYDRQKNLSNY